MALHSLETVEMEGGPFSIEHDMCSGHRGCSSPGVLLGTPVGPRVPPRTLIGPQVLLGTPIGPVVLPGTPVGPGVLPKTLIGKPRGAPRTLIGPEVLLGVPIGPGILLGTLIVANVPICPAHSLPGCWWEQNQKPGSRSCEGGHQLSSLCLSGQCLCLGAALA
jgi:hypothetical protein